MSGLDRRDSAVLRDLLGAELAEHDAVAVAAAIDDLRAGLPAFRRAAARLLAEAADR